MARIPTIAAVASKPWRTHQGPGALTIGPAVSADPSTIGAALVSVGLTTGGIEWNPNIESTPLQSDQTFNPYDTYVTSWSHQISTTLDQCDIWNLALAMSYQQASVTVSSMITLDGYAGVDGISATPQGFKSVQLITEGAKNTFSDADATQLIEFFKSKVIATGPISYARDAKSGVPITIYGLGNSSDVVGYVSTTIAIANPLYE